jgi:NAD(P)-dependent dehydrogenase (short-subunit alcohol dehydrogenase family)
METQAFTIVRSELKGPASSTTLVTGGSSGIGLETVLLLHSISNTNKVIVLDRQPPQSAPKSLTDSPRFLFQQCDLTNWSSQRAAFAAGVKKFGSIDNVFVNAGVAEYKDQFFHDELDAEGLLKEPDRRTIEIDTNAANDTVKLAIHHIRNRKDGKKGGSIVMTASLAGYLASAGAPLYSAAKHGKRRYFDARAAR